MIWSRRRPSSCNAKLRELRGGRRERAEGGAGHDGTDSELSNFTPPRARAAATPAAVAAVADESAQNID